MSSDLRNRLLVVVVLSVLAIYLAIPIDDKPGFKDGQWFEGRVYKLGLDLQGGVEMTLVVDSTGEDRKPLIDAGGKQLRPARPIRELTERVREVIEKRINIKGLKEPVIRAQGNDKVLIQLPGIDEAEVARVKALLQRAGRLEFRIVARDSEMDQWKGPPNAPAGMEWLPNEPAHDDKRKFLLCDSRAPVTGEDVVTAVPEVDTSKLEHLPGGGSPWHIKFQFNPMGGRKFGELTGPNVERRLAIVLDGVVRSAPVIRHKITDEGVIEGNFNETEARDLAMTLKSGSLPCRVAIEGQGAVSYVGATLGEDSIRSGTLACLLSFAIVAVFMVIYYRALGVVAVIGLFLNLVYILAVMALFGATFTLPGFAGLLLTIGMAVDGNILVYERMREEREKGKTPAQAFDAGYDRAFITIVDSNLTTLLATIILYFFGTGPIQGFAVTTSIGILTTLFSVLFCCKVIIRWSMAMGILRDFRMLRFFSLPKISYTRLFRACTILSLVVIGAGLAAIFVRGEANFSPDFRGGTIVQPRFIQDIPTADLRKALDVLQVVDAKGSPVQKYPDIEILSVIPPEEGKGLGQGIGNIFKQFGRSGSREHQIRTGRQYAGLLEEPIESVLPDKSADPFHKGVKLTFIPARVVSNAAEVQAIVEKALPADSLAPVKPKVELLPQQGNVPAPVAVSLPPRQAEHRGNVVAALRKGIGVVASLRDDVMELYAGRLTPEPFGVDRPATDNPRDPLYGGKTITVNLQSPAPASALAGVLKDFFGQVVKPEETYRVEPSGATGDAPASAHNVSLSATAWARVEEVKRAFREAGTRTSPPFVLSKGPFQKEESIGSAVAHDLKSSAIMATILSWVGMILYLALRFRTWLHGIAAVVALVHDVLVALGFIALCGVLVPKAFGLQFEFSLQTVAAALTIIGFSVNDTIVIFDRIRENSQLMRRESLRNIIDLSVNQTMSRTILTSLTVFMVVTLLYAVTMRSAGGIADFAFPMIIGVISGTYSTIFIASPFLLLGRPAEFSAKPPAPVP